jgi:dimethylamine monooxygenase subunit A
MAMGLRPLDLAKWLEVDEKRDEELRYKAELLDSQRDVVVATLPGSEDACDEVLNEVTHALELFYPELARSIDVGEHPLVSSARLVQEDLCVLEKSDTWRLSAAVVCFPSRWSLATKIGTTLDDIHQPVPLYDEKLQAPTNAFFDRMTPDKSVWRLNWTLLDNADLHQPRSLRKSPEADLSQWFFRVERQTLRQLPKTGCVLFTIRNYVTSAATLVASDENFGPALLQSLETAPLEVQEYKGWIGVAEKLRASLRNE